MTSIRGMGAGDFVSQAYFSRHVLYSVSEVLEKTSVNVLTHLLSGHCSFCLFHISASQKFTLICNLPSLESSICVQLQIAPVGTPVTENLPLSGNTVISRLIYVFSKIAFVYNFEYNF